ncbi:MAG: hypothetical protein AB1486_13605 [Planctomycetota bacterium]
MTELPVQRMLLRAIAVLEDLSLQYIIMGGFAVRNWGIPRPTYAADLAVAVSDEGLLGLLQALAKAGFDVPEEHEGGFQDTVGGLKKVKVTQFAVSTVWEIDLFLVRGAFLEGALNRRRRRTLEGRSVWVAAPEDLIVLKLMAFRRKDQLDIEEILKINPDLDRSYLQDWAERLGLARRLAAFLPDVRSS